MFSGLAMRLLRALDAETAHRLALKALTHGLVPSDRTEDPHALQTHLWGRAFVNPIGLAAGFDKSGVAIDEAFGLGVGFAEIGGVTPKPQAGNPRPRLFRLASDRSVFNRMGLNNDGAEQGAARVSRRARRGSGQLA